MEGGNSIPKRILHEDFISKIKTLSPNIEVLGTYINNHTPILCKCKIDNYEWYSIPSGLMSGRGCPKCKGVAKSTDEEFLQKMNIKHPNIKILSKYINSKTKVKCECVLDGFKWEATPNSLLNGNGCSKCSNKVPLTQDEFIEKVNVFKPNITVLGHYVNYHTKVKCKCNICENIWDVYPSNLLKKTAKTGCPVCGVNLQRLSQEEFVNKMKITNPTIEVVGKYINMFTHAKCKCNVCGHIWDANPSSLYQKHGCPICGLQKISKSKRKTHTEFIQQISTINPDIEILSEYITEKQKVKCRCKIDGNTWYASPDNLLQGYGCPACKESKGERRIKNFLESNCILYIQYQKYDDLIGVGEGKLSYDFYLPSYHLLIEFQGEQHKFPVEYFGGEKRFEIQQEHDRRKREYARKHNIELLEIWYYDFDNIEQILESRLLKQSA